MKRITSLLLALCLIFSFSMSAYATVIFTSNGASASYSFKTRTYTDIDEINPYEGLEFILEVPNYLGTIEAEITTSQGKALTDVRVVYVPSDQWDGDNYYGAVSGYVINKAKYHIYTGSDTVVGWTEWYNYGFLDIDGGTYIYDENEFQLHLSNGPGLYTALATIPFSEEDDGITLYTEAAEKVPENIQMTAAGYYFLLVLNDEMVQYFLDNGTLSRNAPYEWPGLYELLDAQKVRISAPRVTVGLFNFVDKNIYTRETFKDMYDAGAKWYYDYVIKVYRLGLMQGDVDGCFKPENDITLAQLIAMAARFHSIYNGGRGEFNQGPVWYSVYLNYAVANGIIKEDDFDDLSRPATRAEMCYIFSNAIDLSDLEPIREMPQVGDLHASTPYYTPITMLYMAGVVDGYLDGNFRPNANIKRGEAAKIISLLASGRRPEL